MKIIDVPQTGKLGLTVTYPGRSGLIRRSWVVPANPKTGDQLVVRSRLARFAAMWDALTESQQDGWITAAAGYQSKPSLGQSGPLTGLQLFVRINTNLDVVGEPVVQIPPARPEFDANVAQGLELTNPSGVPAIKLTCSGTSDAFNIVSACAPQKSGTRRPISWRMLGELPEVVTGKADLTSLYNAKFGAPAAGERIFVQSRQMQDGWQDNAIVYTGLIPASS